MSRLTIVHSNLTYSPVSRRENVRNVVVDKHVNDRTKSRKCRKWNMGVY